MTGSKLRLIAWALPLFVATAFYARLLTLRVANGAALVGTVSETTSPPPRTTTPPPPERAGEYMASWQGDADTPPLVEGKTEILRQRVSAVAHASD